MKRPPACNVVDFETDPIQARPEYPPKPVGVSIKRPGKKDRYYAWGHYTGNNDSSFAEGRAAVAEVWAERHHTPLLFQNAQFDIDVAVTHMGMEPVSWDEFHDTMFLLFLWDPHAPDLKLKPSAERILGEAPEERDEMIAWLKANKKRLIAETDIARWKYVHAGVEKSYINSTSDDKLGALVAYAPGDIAGKYARGDTRRTDGLFKYLWPRIIDNDMGEAYDRERQIMPILLENERVGMRVDVPVLRRDIKLYSGAMDSADAWLRKRLKSPSLNLDADKEVAEALSRNGVVRDEDWTLTAKNSERSVSKKNLRPDMFQDAKVASVFGYRNRLATCLKMFMLPWERQCNARGDSHISTNWNQVRQPGGGTRTGRPSTSNPNFLNLSKTWHDKDDGYAHPAFVSGLPDLPLVRRYILPDVGGSFVHRDFDGQELRIAAHFEDGPLMRAYQDDPHMDVHDHVRQLIKDIAGLEYHRTQVKVTNFRRIYGGGAPATAAALNVSMEVAKQLLTAHGQALPGLKDLGKQITAMSKAGDPIVTWGGRQYYAEPPKFDERFKRMMTYEYKLMNYLVQGSAADATKEAIIRHHNHPKRDARFLVTVYDEINISCDKRAVAEQMAILRECMEGLEFDVPLLSSGKTGPNWAELKKYKEEPYRG